MVLLKSSVCHVRFHLDLRLTDVYNLTSQLKVSEVPFAKKTIKMCVNVAERTSSFKMKISHGVTQCVHGTHI